MIDQAKIKKVRNIYYALTLVFAILAGLFGYMGNEANKELITLDETVLE